MSTAEVSRSQIRSRIRSRNRSSGRRRTSSFSEIRRIMRGSRVQGAVGGGTEGGGQQKEQEEAQQ